MRPINLDCPEERDTRDYALSVRGLDGIYRGPWCLKEPPKHRGAGGACCRRPGHAGPHMAITGGLDMIWDRWIEEDFNDEGNAMCAGRL